MNALGSGMLAFTLDHALNLQTCVLGKPKVMPDSGKGNVSFSFL